MRQTAERGGLRTLQRLRATPARAMEIELGTTELRQLDGLAMAR